MRTIRNRTGQFRVRACFVVAISLLVLGWLVYELWGSGLWSLHRRPAPTKPAKPQQVKSAPRPPPAPKPTPLPPRKVRNVAVDPPAPSWCDDWSESDGIATDTEINAFNNEGGVTPPDALLQVLLPEAVLHNARAAFASNSSTAITTHFLFHACLRQLNFSTTSSSIAFASSMSVNPCDGFRNIVAGSSPQEKQGNENNNGTTPKRGVVRRETFHHKALWKVGEEAAVNALAYLLHHGLVDDDLHADALFEVDPKQKASSGGLVGEFGTYPSLQRVFDHIRTNRRDTCSVGRGFDDVTSFPLLGFICTSLDFPLLLNHIVHIDNSVRRWVFTVNGPGVAPRVFLKAVAKVLSPWYVTVYTHANNAGVSHAWNTILREGFYPSEGILVEQQRAALKKQGNNEDGRKLFIPPSVPFVTIANADVMAAPGHLSRFCRSTFENREKLVVNRFAHFAFFAVTRLGMQELGFFDENIYPAYGEDVEYHVRAVSRGLGKESAHFGKHGNNLENVVFWHYSSPNRRHDSQTYNKVNSFPLKNYLLQKWGVLMNVVDYQNSNPYRSPFNNSKISHASSWTIDTQLRLCVVNHGKKCSLNVAAMRVLENVKAKPLE